MTAFDRYRDGYKDEVQRSISFMGQNLDFFTEAKTRHLVDIARRHFTDPGGVRALDVGCGVGLTEEFLSGRFGSLTGVDTSGPLLEAAAARNRDCTYVPYDGDRLPFEDGAFDFSFAINVFHHVTAQERARTMTEIERVTTQGGAIVVFEHNPANPLTRLAVRRCEFDHDVTLLSRNQTRELLSSAGVAITETRYIIFFPWAAKVLGRIERTLATVPLGAQYYVAGRKAGVRAGGLRRAAG